MLKSEKDIIKAIHVDDLEALLENLGLLTQIKNGTLFCGICQVPLALDKISALYTKNGTPFLVCDKDACYHEMLKSKSD